MSTLIHAADIGNGGTAFDTYLMWSALVMQEFNYQLVCEEKRGFSPTTMFRYKGEVPFYKGQIFFLGRVIREVRVSIIEKHFAEVSRD